jgi:hypothetical protein
MYTRAVLRHNGAIARGVSPPIAAGSITIGVTRGPDPDADDAVERAVGALEDSL